MKEYSLKLQQNANPDAKDADYNRLKSQLEKQQEDEEKRR